MALIINEPSCHPSCIPSATYVGLVCEDERAAKGFESDSEPEVEGKWGGMCSFLTDAPRDGWREGGREEGTSFLATTQSRVIACFEINSNRPVCVIRQKWSTVHRILTEQR